MKNLFLTLSAAVLATTASLNAANPVAEFYPDGYPAWTDNIEWDNVIDMKTDGRITSVTGEWARFEKGIELLGAQGGVLYYPAGTYTFSDLPAGENGAAEDGKGLMLRSGVVIMGEKPSATQLACDVEGGLITLGTVFEFPTYGREVVGAGDQTVIKQTPGHWNFVGIMPREGQELKDVDNVGVCFVNFKNAGVYWGAQYTWAESYQDPARHSYGAAGCDASKGWMPNRVADGTHYMDPFSGCKKVSIGGEDGTEYLGAGKGRLILACRFDNAVLLDAGGYDGDFKDGYEAGKTKNFKGLPLEPYRFGARITIDASNVFIGATAVTKPTNAFLYKATLQMASKDPIGDRYNQSMMLDVPQLFDPAKHIGMDIGKGILGLVTKAQRHMLEDNAPFYEPNIIVRDCYVYNHGNKGYEISGRWVKVVNNVNDRDFLAGGTIPNSTSPENIPQIGDAAKVYGLTDKISYKIRSASGTVDVAGEEGHYIARLSGLRGTNQTDDNMSRAFDMGGHNVWIDGNSYWDTGSWPGNDGEGILGQRSGEIEAFSWAVTNNEASLKKSTSKSGYMSTYDMHTIGSLWYANKGQHGEWTAGPVGVNISGDKTTETAVINNVRGSGAAGSGDIKELSDPVFGPIWVTSTAPKSGVLAPSGVKAEINEELGFVEISWNPDYEINGDNVTDKSNEVGYRVDRRKVGTEDWTVIAYRPMQNGQKVLTGVNRTFKGESSWTLEEMDLNPPVWRDYERLDGEAEYRVVALSADPTADVEQTEPYAKVDFGIAGIGMTPVATASMRYDSALGQVKISQNAASIKVFAISGGLMGYAANTEAISVNNLPAGIYIVVADVDGISNTLKIVKK